VQGNAPESLRWKRVHAAGMLRRYVDLTREGIAAAISEGRAPDLVVWPENALQTPVDDPTYGPPLRKFAEGLDRPLLLGVPRSEAFGEQLRHYNSAAWLEKGSAPRFYDKRRLLPFSESDPTGALRRSESRGDLDAGRFSPGTGPGLFRLAEETLGVLICFEALYPEMTRELARAGADVLVVLSNDGWYRGRGGAEQHLAQVVFRAIETGLPVVRATTTGISTLVSPRGAVMARLGEDEQGVLLAPVPARRAAPTLYTRIGDAFALGCAAALGLAAVLSVAAPARSPRPSRRAPPAAAAERASAPPRAPR
jgi:apolipoprotein N-acyltransferase